MMYFAFSQTPADVDETSSGKSFSLLLPYLHSGVRPRIGTRQSKEAVGQYELRTVVVVGVVLTLVPFLSLLSATVKHLHLSN